MGKESVKVAVRVRPFNAREKHKKSDCIVRMKGGDTFLKDPDSGEEKKFGFDYSYWSFDDSNEENYCNQERIFQDIGIGVLDNAFKGYNVSLFAYGQTGSGKSYSMVGYGEDKGIIPQACEEIFKRIEKMQSEEKEFRVEATMVEIYNEKVRDLLNPQNNPQGGLKIREHPKTGPYVEGLKPARAKSYDEIQKLMEMGTAARTIGSTNMNATSSRAHTLFTIGFTQIEQSKGKKMTKTSKINLVDLAGSERQKSTGATGQRAKEGIAINKSLSSLGNCIKALADKATGKKKILVPYRDSKLTFIMKESLGGNSKTIMIAAISPASVNYDETLSTLRYADRAKRIKNKAVVNESATDKLIRSLREEIESLKEQIKKKGEGNQQVVTKIIKEENEEKTEELMSQLSHAQSLIDQYEQSKEEAEKQNSKLEEDRNQYFADLGIVHFNRKKQVHLMNLDEDPSMTNSLFYPLNLGENKIGSGEGISTIRLDGKAIQPQQAVITVKSVDNGPITQEATISIVNDDCEVYVNGNQMQAGVPITLQNRDRVVFGTSHFFKFVHPEASTGSSEKIDYEEAIREIAAQIAKEHTKELIEDQRRVHETEKKELEEEIQKLHEDHQSQKQHLDELDRHHREREAELKEEFEEKLAVEMKKSVSKPKTIVKTIYKTQKTKIKFRGLLMVTVVSARSLCKVDFFGSADPYVTLSLYDFENQVKVRQKTDIKKNTLKPNFNNACFVFNVTDTDRLELMVKDWNRILSDRFLGKIVLDISKVPKRNCVDRFFPLEGVAHGELHIKFWYA